VYLSLSEEVIGILLRIFNILFLLLSDRYFLCSFSLRINLHQAHEIRYRTNKWTITETTLRTAVAAAVVLVKDVEAWLRRNGSIR